MKFTYPINLLQRWAAVHALPQRSTLDTGAREAFKDAYVEERSRRDDWVERANAALLVIEIERAIAPAR